MMPECSGWKVMETIRPNNRVPVLMLTAKSTEQDELTGFKLGVDDYIKKPFSPVLLLARVNALLQRTYGIESNLIKGDLTINYANHSINIHTQSLDENVNLSQKEFQLLSTLIENENQVLTRDQLLIKVWGYDYDGTERTVDTHMNRLRIKLKDIGDYIQTVRGYGYKFEVTK
jgi:DNA-binding response OmpR family regulator